MMCNQYEAFELGELSEAKFKLHLETCPICERLVRQDSELVKISRSLNEPAKMPELWGKVRSALEAEMEKKKSKPFILQKYPAIALAATLVIAVGLTSFFLSRTSEDPGTGRLLTNKLLDRVIMTEQNYEKAIQELEATAQNQFVSMDLDLMLLYRDRLETIDTQIARCREALKTNPANAHIRRYLLAALQDKRETLEDIVNQPADQEL